MFGRGFDYESIINGKLANQIAKEAQELQNKILKSAIIQIENVKSMKYVLFLKNQYSRDFKLFQYSMFKKYIYIYIRKKY